MRRIRTARTCREAENPPVIVALSDSNAPQTDAFVYSASGTIGISFTDHNDPQTDAMDVSMSFAVADSNAGQTDALAAKLSAVLADFNSTQTDIVVPSARVVLADSNATPTDALVASVVPTFPPTGALYAWRADLGITGGPTPITSWTDQVAGKVLNATGWNQVNDAFFNNQKSLQSTGLTSFFATATRFSPAIPVPYWFFFVARNTNTFAGSAIWDQGLTTTQLFFGGGDPSSGVIRMATNASSLSLINIDTRVATAGAVFVGGNGQTSKIFDNAQTPGITQVNIFNDGTIVNNSNATIGNRVFNDQAVTTMVEFGIADNTFNVSSWLTYAGSRYGITIGP